MTLASHSAPGANAGFAFQFERALWWLSKSPAGWVVGIETADDVAVFGKDGSKLLEQDKHSVREDTEPFGDRSHDLWNTLAIWVEAIQHKEVPPDASRFLMVTNKQLGACIARQIGAASKPDEVDACVGALEDVSKTPPNAIASLVPRVMAPESRASLCTVILNSELVDGSQASCGAALRAQTISELPLPGWCSATADSICNELMGWLHSCALENWRNRQPAWIQRDSFVNQLDAVLNRRKREIARERAENLLPVPDESLGEAKSTRFVKQLYLVTDDNAVVDGAIRDFIRCNIEKSRLSAEGNISDGDWTAFQATLVSRWQRIRSRVLRMQESKDERRVGFHILTDTTSEHREKLAGADTEQVYLTSGTYHRLADTLHVGWHPRFIELMRGETKSQ